MHGYGLLVPLLLGNALAQALIAVPSAIASRFSSRAGLTIWLITLGMLVVAVVVLVVRVANPWGVHLWHEGAWLTFFLIMPQALAYPLTPKSPGARIAVAFGLGIAAAFVWMLAGALSGATPD